MDGIIVVDKSAGATSHDVCSSLRKILNFKKIGHAGTLDPIATGVLVVLVGKAARLNEYITADDKIYQAGIKFGLSTDTCDITGKTLYTKEPEFSEADYENALLSQSGVIEQIPPIYSAIRVDGKHLYEYARQQAEVEIPKRTVEVYSITTVSEELPHSAQMIVSCSKGTYIRSICRDIGEKLNCGATMESLRRVKSGVFELRSAYTIEQIREMHEKGSSDFLLPMDIALAGMKKVTVRSEYAQKLLNGNPIAFGALASDEKLLPGEKVAVYISSQFAAVATVQAEGIKPAKVLI